MKRLGLATLTGVLLGELILGSGCKHAPKAVPLGQQLLLNYVSEAVNSSARKKYGPKGETNVNVNNEYPTNTLPKEKLHVLKWRDFDGDREIEKGEIIGEVNGPIDFSKYGIYICTEPNNGAVYYVLDSSDNRIYKTPHARNLQVMMNSEIIDFINHPEQKNPGQLIFYIHTKDNLFKKEITVLPRN